jgi:hypothetical protein
LWSNILDFSIYAPFILIQPNLRYIANFDAKTALKRQQKGGGGGGTIKVCQKIKIKAKLSKLDQKTQLVKSG